MPPLAQVCDLCLLTLKGTDIKGTRIANPRQRVPFEKKKSHFPLPFLKTFVSLTSISNFERVK